jgi:TPR repeat protein
MRKVATGVLVCGSLAALILPASQLIADVPSSAEERKISQLQVKAEQGFAKEEIALAMAYLTGEGVPQSLALAAHWYEKAAEAGDPGAQNEVGYFYQKGVGVPVDEARALHWFQLSAASGSASGTQSLGVAYLEGLGVMKNPALAEKLFTEAFHRGCGSCAAYLGDMHYFGVGVPQNRALGEEWFKSGWKLHDPIAEFNLGSLYLDYPGHEHDLVKAAGLLRASAEGGYVPAIHSLGLLLVNHPELARSRHEALPLLQAAAEAGSWKSSLLLGILSRDGKGVPADAKAAYYHFQIAVCQGGTTAQKLAANDLKVLEPQLTEDTRSLLQSSAGAWYAQHPLSLLFLVKPKKDGRVFPVLDMANAAHGSFGDSSHPATASQASADSHPEME